MATTKFDWKWIIPIITGIGSITFGVIAWIASHSGSTILNGDGSITESDINVPFFQTGYCWFFVGLAAATVVIIMAMRAEK